MFTVKTENSTYDVDGTWVRRTKGDGPRVGGFNNAVDGGWVRVKRAVEMGKPGSEYHRFMFVFHDDTTVTTSTVQEVVK